MTKDINFFGWETKLVTYFKNYEPSFVSTFRKRLLKYDLNKNYSYKSKETN